MSEIIPSTSTLTVDLSALPVGFARMILDGAHKDANLWTRATGASTETRNHWSRRAAAIKVLLDQLPPPANPRDPFDDIPGEPTPEEAEAIWRARAAAEDVRAAFKRIDNNVREVAETIARESALLEETPLHLAREDDMDDLLS